MADRMLALNPRILIKGLILIATLTAVGYAIKVIDIGALFDTAWVDARIRGQGLTGKVLFVAAGWLMTAVGIPRHFVAFLAGYAFGLGLGLPLALLATVLGCITTLLYARLMGRAFVQRKFPNRARQADAPMA